jgi:hypothetical protein
MLATVKFHVQLMQPHQFTARQASCKRLQLDGERWGLYLPVCVHRYGSASHILSVCIDRCRDTLLC